MTNEQDIIDAVANGNETTTEIAEASGWSEAYTRKTLRQLHEDGKVDREKDGRAYVYSVADDAATGLQSQTTIPGAPADGDADDGSDDDGTTTADAGDAPTDHVADDDRMPVNRDYLNHLDEKVPEGVPEYYAHNGELDEILADIEMRRATGKKAHFLIGGPTGAGKTHLAMKVADERDAALFTLQMRYTMDEADLLGSPFISEGASQWVDGTLVKALLASREREVVLLIDEANRARPEAKGVLFSALDDRAEVVLDGPRGGEVIRGDADNLIVISTINEGIGYHGTQEMDLAEQRRLGAKFNVDHLGKNYPDRETTVVAERSPACPELARLLVKAANDVREQAADATTKVGMGVPTATAIEWAQTAHAYADSDRDIDNPVLAAGRAVVVRRFYDGNESERQEVDQIIRNHVDGCPVGQSDVEAYVDDDLVDEAHDLDIDDDADGDLDELFGDD